MSAPFLKWAGGKRWLTASAQLPVPAKYERYLEPFLGGGAVFFHLKPPRAVLADINQELIDFYEALRDEPVALKRLMNKHQVRHCRDYYYRVRGEVPRTTVGRAARTLYLNRTCWNGLYRVNLLGQFNVPIGTKSTVVFDDEDFTYVSLALQEAEICCADFQDTIDSAEDGDFLFVDPPYTVQHNINGFVKYNERIFSWSDQIRLQVAIRAAVERGAAVVMTNADHDSIRSLYADICEYRKLIRASVLAADAGRRGPTSEALFFANL